MLTGIILSIIFLAVFIQSLSGFGVALIAMGLLPAFLGIQVVTPLIALVALSLEAYLVIYYRENIQFDDVWRVALASLFGIPFGILFLERVREDIVLAILGWFLIVYATMMLTKVRPPAITNVRWGYPAGLLAGLLGGAYNVSGPPVILYANMRRWSPLTFKSNLQGFFVISSAFVVLGHGISGNLTPEVWRYYLMSLPIIAMGIWLGSSLDKFLNPERFRVIVFLLLLVMGARLAF